MNKTENNTTGRASYTDEERRELTEEFKTSGLTQAAFSREWNINPKTLARWLRSERQVDDVAFCEVELNSNKVSADEVRVCLPNRVEVVLPVTSLENLGNVLREAAGCLD